MRKFMLIFFIFRLKKNEPNQKKTPEILTLSTTLDHVLVSLNWFSKPFTRHSGASGTEGLKSLVEILDIVFNGANYESNTIQIFFILS